MVTKKQKLNIMIILVVHPTLLVNSIQCCFLKSIITSLASKKETPLSQIQEKQPLKTSFLRLSYKEKNIVNYFIQGNIRDILNSAQRKKNLINEPIKLKNNLKFAEFEMFSQLNLLDLADFFYKKNPKKYKNYKTIVSRKEPLYDQLISLGAGHSQIYTTYLTISQEITGLPSSFSNQLL